MTLLYENVLTPQTAIDILDDMHAPNDDWRQVKWGTAPSIIELQGIWNRDIWCQQLHADLEQYLAPIVQIKPTFTITYTFYKWEPLSHLIMHDDIKYSFSATLYLNTVWNIDWGGFLVWLDNDNKEHVVKPQFGRLVIFDNCERHLITPISESAVDNRLTIQIRGIKHDHSMGE
tara:strand:- start:2113 stop:2634 length:522 start_codon:yes stop_codon:yes gene_type:complete